MKTVIAFLATLACGTLAFAGGPVPYPTDGKKLTAVFEPTAQVRVKDQAKPVFVISDASKVKEIENAIGGAQGPDAKAARRCPDTLRLEFLDKKGEILGTASFCGPGGLAGKDPFDGAEFSFGAKDNRGRISVADKAALGRALQK
jgi:hypothetical protein